MKRKPWSIIVLSLLHILAPVWNLVVNAQRMGRSVEEHWNYWLHFLPHTLFFIYVIVPPIAGICIFICRRWSYWLYLLCLSAIFASNIYAFWTNMNFLNFIFLCAVLVVDLIVVAYFVVPSVRKVYFDPRVRWWEAAPRYIFHHEIVLNDKEKGLVKNVSQGGLFVTTAMNLEEGQEVQLSWSFEDLFIKVRGKVVYKSTSSAYEGCGVRFAHDRESKKAMRQLVKRLKSRGQLVPARLPTQEDSFIAWMKKLVKTGHGLFPG